MKLFAIFKKVPRLSFGLRQKGGRSHGVITAPRRGGLIKQTYRFLDTKRTQETGEKGAVILDKYIYDPCRTGKISLLLLPNGILTYILAAAFPESQTRVFNLSKPIIPRDTGFSQFINKLPSGTIVFGLNLRPHGTAQICKAAGTSAILLTNKKIRANHILVKLHSGEHRLFCETSSASRGTVSNSAYGLRLFKTAGQVRRYGIRPRVRPSAMNPVDHPMAGRTRGGCAPQSRTGKLSLGVSPRKKKNHQLIHVTARKSRNNRIS